MSNFDLGNMGALFGGLQQKMADMKAKQAAVRAEGSAAGGLVRVVATGEFTIESIHIDPTALDDHELLEDLVKAATNEAFRQVRDRMAASVQELAGGLPIPPGMLGF